jgi:hypothetical protein
MSASTLFPRARGLLAVLAASVVATAGVLVGGATTSGADAAKLRTWERLANCESGQRWHINTGNGYFGGLQFSDPTWDAYKGPRMAGRADKARKKMQIVTAEKLLDNQGWGAWPACSQKLGLTKRDARGEPFPT